MPRMISTIKSEISHNTFSLHVPIILKYEPHLLTLLHLCTPRLQVKAAVILRLSYMILAHALVAHAYLYYTALKSATYFSISPLDWGLTETGVFKFNLLSPISTIVLVHSSCTSVCWINEKAEMLNKETKWWRSTTFSPPHLTELMKSLLSRHNTQTVGFYTDSFYHDFSKLLCSNKHQLHIVNAMYNDGTLLNGCCFGRSN